ncbi:thiazolylpeptide-type bacteriocin [Streptomyces sp. NRRL S-350]|uniref:thiazolylpeptide-type bacteriocin n=1 Tax=Streptomyces sp. NRRL S-350 TaxID=1463902 RepID=UPI0004C02135|nr:thiazolylpeptide-type bacteriocin [Streptomyces sp. NRRL S-350]
MPDPARGELALGEILALDGLDGLDLGELTVTALRDTVALPETGASGVPGSTSCGSSSCAVPHPPTQSF